jgi:hypothetical protein
MRGKHVFRVLESRRLQCPKIMVVAIVRQRGKTKTNSCTAECIQKKELRYAGPPSIRQCTFQIREQILT